MDVPEDACEELALDLILAHAQCQQFTRIGTPDLDRQLQGSPATPVLVNFITLLRAHVLAGDQACHAHTSPDESA